ncbi:glycoside hydrolase family 36 protein [Sporormia fimetaria CBS 119925]|uniref:Glycoside hydrolase family 36 protein n=1 Tax=Sporormia fimetaria CBS 119925 TaxID=1340428 RepID=A0A6A6VQA8_9PLEO|nr:glycoside hydrolase family 36 protein [Sporormia fimetaria CBS 119925]
MFARILSNPALGQTTTIDGDLPWNVKITVLVESALLRSWEVAVWHNLTKTGEWSRLKLHPEPEPRSLLTVGSDNSDIKRQWYAGNLEPPKHPGTFSFTVKFRASEDEPWKWSNEHCSTSDGHIIIRAPEIPSSDLSHYIADISPEINVQKEPSDTPDTLLWSLTGAVPQASGKQSGHSDTNLGRPKAFKRWFALVRLWSPWLAPRQGKGTFDPDKEAVLAAFEREDGTHLVVLAVSGIDDVLTTLYHDGGGKILVTARNDRESAGVARTIAAVGKDLNSAIAAAMYHARKLVTKYEVTTGEVAAEAKALNEGFKPEWLEGWYDGLAYCTWNGIGQDLNSTKVSKALDSLHEHGINIKSLIIDDGWQSCNNEGQDQFRRGWLEFEAAKERFPQGLKATIKDIRAKHKDIQHVAVWHALFGYWGGIAPEGKIAQDYKTTWVQKKDGASGGRMLVVAEEDVQRFYKDFYQFLSSSGIDSVKTDAQFFLDELADADDRRSLMNSYIDAWDISQLRSFAGKAISCMSQTPQLTFHSQLPANKPRILLRNSDDFFPEVPASHPWHIFCNAHNALLSQYLNILPDWDMFQTSHSYGSYHAAARCVSGGPIYITDKPGHHDVDLICQMTGNTPRGDTVIFRPHTVGKSTMAYNSYDDPVLLKIGTYVGMAHTGVSMLGVFNCKDRPLAELLDIRSFPGADAANYLVRCHTTGQFMCPVSPESYEAFIHLELPVQGWEILSAYPLHHYQLGRRHPNSESIIAIAHLGLLGKMTGAAAIVDSSASIEEQSGRLKIWTSLKALGTYGLYVSGLSERNLENDFIALLFGRPIPFHCVKVNDVCPNILEIDTVRAWKETDSKAGWSNEVHVEVVIR